MSNLKLDIIYYKTPSDFEMEFNLSGCCRMRIFKDNIDTVKGLVNTLARDVARSQIILIVTDLAGDNSGIPAISKAIGQNLVSPDKEAFGILTADSVYMPDGAVPLVTKSGIYGGCIIECGPQSIILLSSVRALRHEILKAYVHNYIFDLGQLHAYNERVGQNSTVSMPPIIGRTSTGAQNSANLPDSQPDELDASKKETDNSDGYNPNIILSGIVADDTEEIPPQPAAPHSAKKKTKGRSTNILLLIFVILLLLCFGVLAYFYVYLPLIGEPSVFSDGADNFITNILNLFTE